MGQKGRRVAGKAKQKYKCKIKYLKQPQRKHNPNTETVMNCEQTEKVNEKKQRKLKPA